MEPLTLIWIIAQVFLIWIASDFLTGLVHWWQDTYGNPTWPIIGKYVVKPNLKHHHNPRAMITVSYWNRAGASIVTAILIIVALLFFNADSWQIILLFAFSSQGNEIHAMAHRTNRENGKVIMFLQKIGIIQRRKTHGWHHKAPYDTNFCVMTEYLNPTLNRLQFFDRLEKLVFMLFRIKPLRGAAIRGGV